MIDKKTNRKISVFYFLLLLIITSVILIIYINNTIAVNQLSILNNNIREEIGRNIQENDLLRSEAERLSSFERISSIASEKFSLSFRENTIEDKSIIIKKSELK